MLSGAPPWQWPAWWANTISLGAEMGNAFSDGLLHASGVKTDALDLSGQITAVDCATALKAVCLLSLTKISLASNELKGEGFKSICETVKVNKTLKELDVSCNAGGSAGAKHVADMLVVNGGLTTVGSPAYNPSHAGLRLTIPYLLVSSWISPTMTLVHTTMADSG